MNYTLALLKMDSKAQVWVETVIYILIGLSVIGILLAVITPKINEMRDKSVIDSMISALNEIDSTINTVKLGTGSKGIVKIGLNKGMLIIEPKSGNITFVLDKSNVEYSQPDKTVEIGRIKALTQESKGIINVSLTLDYPSFYLTYNGGQDKKVFNQASLPYRVSIENKGEETVVTPTGTVKVTHIDIASIS